MMTIVSAVRLLVLILSVHLVWADRGNDNAHKADDHQPQADPGVRRPASHPPQGGLQPDEPKLSDENYPENDRKPASKPPQMQAYDYGGAKMINHNFFRRTGLNRGQMSGFLPFGYSHAVEIVSSDRDLWSADLQFTTRGDGVVAVIPRFNMTIKSDDRIPAILSIPADESGNSSTSTPGPDYDDSEDDKRTSTSASLTTPVTSNLKPGVVSQASNDTTSTTPGPSSGQLLRPKDGTYYYLVVIKLSEISGDEILEKYRREDHNWPRLVTITEFLSQKQRIPFYVTLTMSEGDFKSSPVATLPLGDNTVTISADGKIQYKNEKLRPGIYQLLLFIEQLKDGQVQSVSYLLSNGLRLNVTESNLIHEIVIAALVITLLIIVISVIIIVKTGSRDPYGRRHKWYHLSAYWSNDEDYTRRFDNYGERHRTRAYGGYDEEDQTEMANGFDSEEGSLEILSHRIPFDELANYVVDMLVSNGFSNEYKKVWKGQVAAWRIGRRAENRAKNRYGNLLAYDQTLVMLDPETNETRESPGGDYINANFIDGYETSGRYIATQGPLASTVADFWRMIWQTNSRQIAMLTNIEEQGRNKCDRYWPSDEPEESVEGGQGGGDCKTAVYGQYTVMLHDTEQCGDYLLRTFLLSKAGTDDIREVIHYHFTAWPDHSVPSYTGTIISFLNRIRDSVNYKPNQPLTVHCSAGVGRTGTLILIDSMVDMAKREKVVDCLRHLCVIRKQRINLVEKLSQYIFVHKVLVDYFGQTPTVVDDKDYVALYENLKKSEPQEGTD